MASGISIGIAADTRAFAQGVRTGVLQPLESVERALEDVGREGEQAGDDLTDTFKDAQRETKKFEKANEDLADTIAREARRSSKAVRDIGDDGFSSATNNVQEFKNEATQNFSEVASSFDGSIESMADGVQGLTGGLASALTPGIGIPVAILGAAAGAFLASWSASAEETEARIGDMYDDMLESGSAFLSESFVRDAVAELARDTEKFNEALDESERLGVSVQTVLRATVGDQEAINAVVDATNQKRDDELGKLGANKDGVAAIADQQDAVNLKADETIAKYQGISAETQTAADRAAAVAAAFGTGNAVLDEGIRKAQDLRAEIDKLGTGKQIRLDVIPNMDAFERAIGLQQGRTINVNVNGQITKIGNQVW